MDTSTVQPLDKRCREAHPERIVVGDETFERNDIRAKNLSMSERSLNRGDARGAPWIMLGNVKYRPLRQHDAFILAGIQRPQTGGTEAPGIAAVTVALTEAAHIGMQTLIQPLVQQAYEQHNGDLRAGQSEVEDIVGDIVRKMWPQTIKTQAHRFWDQYGGNQAGGFGAYSLDSTLRATKKLSDALRAEVLALIDREIEGKSRRDEPWAFPLIFPHKRTDKFHPAAVLTPVLSHSMFRHVDAKRAGALLACPKGRVDEPPLVNFADVVGQFAYEFGLWCSECEKVHRLDCSAAALSGYRLGCSETGYHSHNFDERHTWNTGMCPACWQRDLPRRRREASRHREEVARDLRAANQANVVKRPAAKPKRAKKTPKPRQHRPQYSKKVLTWKAAYDALREMGVPIEDEAK
jgi:hypothetical protein